MRLANFILANAEPILKEWDAYAATLDPGGTMNKRDLRDDAEAILLATAQGMKDEQSLAQQKSKSEGKGGADTAEDTRLDDASARHGRDRIGWGFDLNDVLSEYRALRASVLRLWRKSRPQPDLDHIDDITRFNEAIDQSLAEAVDGYTKHLAQSQQFFLAILGHDLRNPLNFIRMATQIVALKNGDPESTRMLTMIEKESVAMERLIGDLTDFALTWMGGTMPLNRQPFDLEELCREVVDECRTLYPQHTLHIHLCGDLTGVWDGARLRQLIFNLLANAHQHGSPEGPIKLSAASEGSNVVLSVHNKGAPIPPEALPTLFDPMVRHTTFESTLRRASGSLGLGLYIVREIIHAEEGTISVASTAQQGTTFTVRIPRMPGDEGQPYPAPSAPSYLPPPCTPPSPPKPSSSSTIRTRTSRSSAPY